MESNKYHNVLDSEIIHSPIEYKTLDISDFEDALEVKKDILEVPDGKYLTSPTVNATKKIEPWVNNTVVFNASVGQGKSQLAIEIARRYYRFGHTVIFAVPHKSLISEYIHNLGKEIRWKLGSDPSIPDYNAFEYVDEDEPTLKNVKVSGELRLHVITINCLLGNSGDFTEQATLKRIYINNIIQSTKARKKKVILLFDEIHDGVHNFRPDLIFNLWKFRINDVLLKTFIFSATFNEASKVVIKYIAEITDKKLHIIESTRNQYLEKLSNLHLHITSRMNYDLNDNEMKELFDKIIETHNNLDILTYSKKQAIDITNNITGGSIKQKLIDKYETVNLCIAKENLERLNSQRRDFENVTFSEKYIHGVCNIGTMFKTGISITKEDSALIIFLPNKYAMQKSNKEYGIFYDGIISLTQALARVRKKSDIYIIMPTPYYLIDGEYWQNLPPLELFNNLANKTKHLFNSSENEDKKKIETYSSANLNEQSNYIFEKYTQLENRISEEILFVKALQEENQRNYLPPLTYPSLDLFKLNEGEKFLSSYYAIFGVDLPAYMLWGGYNNQFVNCKLKSISIDGSRDIKIEEGRIQEALLELFLEYCNDSFEGTNLCDYDLYNAFCNKIFFNRITYSGKKILRSDEKFQGEIMSFIQRVVKGNSWLNKKYFKEDTALIDKPFEAEDYLLCCISNAMQFDENKDSPIENTLENNLITTYKELHQIRQLFIDKLTISHTDSRIYIHKTFKSYIENPFTDDEIELTVNAFSNINNDIYFKYLKKNRVNLEEGEALNSIYNLLKNTFFRTRKDEKITLANGRRKNVKFIDEIIPLPEQRTGINLLYKYKYMKNENYEKKVLEEIAIDEYNMPDWGDEENCPTTLIEDENGNLVILEEQEETDEKF